MFSFSIRDFTEIFIINLFYEIHKTFLFDRRFWNLKSCFIFSHWKIFMQYELTPCLIPRNNLTVISWIVQVKLAPTPMAIHPVNAPFLSHSQKFVENFCLAGPSASRLTQTTLNKSLSSTSTLQEFFNPPRLHNMKNGRIR